jgi:flagellar basal-body rod protein FlgC
MAMFDAMRNSAAGMTAHRLWMDVIASNLANAESTRSLDGGAFRRQLVVLSSQADQGGVKVDSVTADPSPLREVYDPGHPDADPAGIVRYPNVDPVREMVDMMAASRAFEANAVAMTTSKTMMLRALEIGRG